MIRYSTATEDDYDALKTLWKEVFKEEEVFLNTFFASRLAFNHIFTARQDSQIIAALHALPAHYHQEGRLYPCSYVVGAATYENYRNRGVMGRLLENVKGSSSHPVTLFPAAHSYYEKQAFKTTSSLFNYPLRENSFKPREALEIDTEHLNFIYRGATQKEGALERDKCAWHFLTSGYQTLLIEGAYAFILGETAVEAMALDQEAAKALLALLTLKGIKSVQISPSSPFFPLYEGLKGKEIPMGMSSSSSMMGVYIAEQY
ncbi:MAG: GNAT family N-acetyltransferase [Sphaerochaetaceae bacterium]